MRRLPYELIGALLAILALAAWYGYAARRGGPADDPHRRQRVHWPLHLHRHAAQPRRRRGPRPGAGRPNRRGREAAALARGSSDQASNGGGNGATAWRLVGRAGTALAALELS